MSTMTIFKTVGNDHFQERRRVMILKSVNNDYFKECQ